MIQTNPFGGQFLVAMPHMPDARFLKSVILLCGQDDRGVVGFIINRLIGTCSVKDLIDQLKIPSYTKEKIPYILFGGPVDMTRGFVLHTPDYKTAETLTIIPGDQGVCLTSTLDVLTAISVNEGPRKYMVALGYSGWDEGQLEEELTSNTWLLTKADPELVFDNDISTKWSRVFESLKIDPTHLSLTTGQA